MGFWHQPIDDLELGFWIRNRQPTVWPAAHTKRAFGGYWFPNGGRDPAPMLTNYLLRFEYRGSGREILWVAHQCDPIDEFHCYSDSGVNELGQRLQMHVRNQPNIVNGHVGIEFEWIYDREGFADAITTKLFFHKSNQLPTAAVRYDIDWPRVSDGPQLPSFWETGPDIGDAESDWTVGRNPFIQIQGIHLIFWSYLERYPLPGEVAAPASIGSTQRKATPPLSTLGETPIAAETLLD